MVRKAETIIGIVGGILSFLIFGLFSVTILTTDIETFENSIYSILPHNPAINDVNEAYDLMRQFSIWISIFLFLMVIVLVFATLFIFRNGKPRLAGIFYIVTALLLLIGTQGIGFPFAFLFLVSAYLSFFKRDVQDTNRENLNEGVKNDQLYN